MEFEENPAAPGRGANRVGIGNSDEAFPVSPLNRDNSLEQQHRRALDCVLACATRLAHDDFVDCAGALAMVNFGNDVLKLTRHDPARPDLTEARKILAYHIWKARDDDWDPCRWPLYIAAEAAVLLLIACGGRFASPCEQFRFQDAFQDEMERSPLEYIRPPAGPTAAEALRFLVHLAPNTMRPTSAWRL
jgi:hypothetical protein